MKKQIAIVIILLLGIVISVFLSQRQQNLKSKAALEVYSAFGVSSPNGQVSCSGNVCSTNTLNITMSLRDLTALETTSEVISQTPEQNAREDYSQTINEEPVVDDQSQNSALSAYFKSAQDVADSEDQEYARERGLPDAQTQNLISNLGSALENGQQIPDELWNDYSLKLGNLSQGAIDLATSQLQQAKEKGEQQKAQEELAKVEAATAQQQEKITQALDRWSGMPALEKAETLREYYNLPLGTDPEQVLSFADKAMTLGGVEFRSGPQASTVGPYGVHLNTDLSSFIITESPKSTSEYLSVPTPDLVRIVQGAIETGKNLYDLYQAMPPEKAVEVYFSLSPEARDKVNEAMLNGTKEIAGAAVQMIPFVGTNILSERVNGLNSNMAQIAEKLKDPNLTAEEKEALKQEYFSSLNEIQDVKKDLVINAAFDLVGGVPGSALAERAAGKGSLVAKELFLDTKVVLQAAKQAGKEGLEGVWVGGRQLTAVEKGATKVVEGGAKKTEIVLKDIDSSLVSKASDEFSAIEARDIRGAGDDVENLRDYRQIGSALTETVFGVSDPNIAREFGGFMFSGKSPEQIIEALQQADRFITDFNSSRSFLRISPETKAVWDSLKYEAKEVLNKVTDTQFLLPGQTWQDLARANRVELGEKILFRENRVSKVENLIEKAERPLDKFIKREIANGASPMDLTPLDEVLDPSVFHLVDRDNWPRDPDLVEASGITFWSDNNIIIKSGTGERVGVTCHEACHRASHLGNPGFSKGLRELFGAENADKLIEGGTEHFTQKVAQNSGERIERAFPSQVEMMTKIEGELVNAGISPEKASAMMTTGEWGGKWDKVIETLGKDKMKEILDAAPSVVRNTSAERFVSPADIDRARKQAERELEAISQANRSGAYNFEESRLSFLIADAYAQEDVQSKATNLNAAAFEYLVRKNLAKNTLKEDGKINNQYIQELLETDVLSQPPRQTAKGYELVTGKSGTIEGEIGEGRYLVNLDSMTDLDIKVPSVVEVKSGTTIVPVGIREGSGKVEKTTGLSMGIGKEELPKVQVAAFYDENGNGKWDGSEKALPWAGIQVTLSKVTQEKTINLEEGWNLITLPVLPSAPLTAKALLAQIAKQGGSATAVSTLENGFWKSYVVKDHQDYSKDNFPIEPGKAYFVKALKRSTLSFTGQEFPSPVKVSLKQGWNAIGFPKISKQHKSGDLGVSEDFIIEENKSYLLKVKKEIDFSP